MSCFATARRGPLGSRPPQLGRVFEGRGWSQEPKGQKKPKNTPPRERTKKRKKAKKKRKEACVVRDGGLGSVRSRRKWMRALFSFSPRASKKGSLKSKDFQDAQQQPSYLHVGAAAQWHSAASSVKRQAGRTRTQLQAFSKGEGGSAAPRPPPSPLRLHTAESSL